MKFHCNACNKSYPCELTVYDDLGSPNFCPWSEWCGISRWVEVTEPERFQLHSENVVLKPLDRKTDSTFFELLKEIFCKRD